MGPFLKKQTKGTPARLPASRRLADLIAPALTFFVRSSFIAIAE
jgi:hypothetical protein